MEWTHLMCKLRITSSQGGSMGVCPPSFLSARSKDVSRINLRHLHSFQTLIFIWYQHVDQWLHFIIYSLFCMVRKLSIDAKSEEFTSDPWDFGEIPYTWLPKREETELQVSWQSPTRPPSPGRNDPEKRSWNVSNVSIDKPANGR